MAEVTKQEMISLMYEFALNDPSYRESLKKNPKKVLEKQMGRDFPESLKVEAVQESADKLYLVVPYVPEAGDELSDSDLEQVAGGKGGSGESAGSGDSGNTYTCNDAAGIATRVQINTEASVF